MFSIEGEHAHARPLTTEDMRRLLTAGVPPRALNRHADGRYAPIRRDHVVFLPRARFEFMRHVRGEDGAVAAFVVPLLDRFGEDADILAFRPDGAYGLWLGAVAMAGEEHAFAPRLSGPLAAHDDVMSWLRDGRCGVAVLRHDRAAHDLDGQTLRVTNADFARRLRAQLTRHAPRIIVDPPATAAARAVA